MENEIIVDLQMSNFTPVELKSNEEMERLIRGLIDALNKNVVYRFTFRKQPEEQQAKIDRMCDEIIKIKDISSKINNDIFKKFIENSKIFIKNMTQNAKFKFENSFNEEVNNSKDAFQTKLNVITNIQSKFSKVSDALKINDNETKFTLVNILKKILAVKGFDCELMLVAAFEMYNFKKSNESITDVIKIFENGDFCIGKSLKYFDLMNRFYNETLIECVKVLYLKEYSYDKIRTCVNNANQCKKLLLTNDFINILTALFNVFNSTFIEIENKFNDENFSICIVEKWLCYKEFSLNNLFDKVADSFAVVLSALRKRDFIKIISSDEFKRIQRAVTQNIVNADEIAINLIANLKKLTPFLNLKSGQKTEDSPCKKPINKADLKNDDFEQANFICQTDIMDIYKEMIAIKCFNNADSKENCFITNELIFAFYIFLNDINYDKNIIVCTPKYVLNQGVKFFTPSNPKTNIDDFLKFSITKLADNLADSVNNGELFFKERIESFKNVLKLLTNFQNEISYTEEIEFSNDQLIIKTINEDVHLNTIIYQNTILLQKFYNDIYTIIADLLMITNFLKDNNTKIINLSIQNLKSCFYKIESQYDFFGESLAKTFEERININNKNAQDVLNELKDQPKDVLYNKITTRLMDVLISLDFSYMFFTEKLKPLYDALTIVDNQFLLIKFIYINYSIDLYKKLSGNKYSLHYVMTFFNENNNYSINYYKKSNDLMNELIKKVDLEIDVLKKSIIYDFDSVRNNDKLMRYITDYNPLKVLTTIAIDEDHFYDKNFFYFQANYEFLKYNYIFQNVYKIRNIELNKNYLIAKLSFMALAGQFQIFESAKKIL
ncbi:hypothetical protein GVAV_000519 [Gurleya vavrai]